MIDLLFYFTAVLLWLFTGLIIWFVWADGIWFLAWGRTGQACLLFATLGPVSILSFPVEWIMYRIIDPDHPEKTRARVLAILLGMMPLLMAAYLALR
jgi:hypothetical protein